MIDYCISKRVYKKNKILIIFAPNNAVWPPGLDDFDNKLHCILIDYILNTLVILKENTYMPV
jgi:hypothetical protein